MSAFIPVTPKFQVLLKIHTLYQNKALVIEWSMEVCWLFIQGLSKRFRSGNLGKWNKIPA